jgi:hypothetical protein
MLLVTADPPLAQQASLWPTTASRPWSSPTKHKNRFCYRGISTSSQKPTTSAPTNSSPSPTVSPLHLPAGRRRVTRAHPKHSPFGGGGGMVWQYARNPHSLPLLPPEKDRVCHPTNRYPASPRKKIASANRPRAVRNRYPASPRIRLHRQQVMDMEMRESRADAGKQRGSTIRMIVLDDLLFLKARRQGRREDVKWHEYALVVGRETRTNITYLTLSVRGTRRHKYS